MMGSAERAAAAAAAVAAAEAAAVAAERAAEAIAAAAAALAQVDMSELGPCEAAAAAAVYHAMGAVNRVVTGLPTAVRDMGAAAAAVQENGRRIVHEFLWREMLAVVDEGATGTLGDGTVVYGAGEWTVTTDGRVTAFGAVNVHRYPYCISINLNGVPMGVINY